MKKIVVALALVVVLGVAGVAMADCGGQGNPPVGRAEVPAAR